MIITSLVAIYFSETVRVSNRKGIKSWNLAQIQVNIMENGSINILKFVICYATLEHLTIT